MRRRAVVVDVAIDQGGCFETSRPTTRQEPTYEPDGVLHYCVAHMPGAVPATSTRALTNTTLPYVISLATHGWRAAMERDRFLARGLNATDGHLVHESVAATFAPDEAPDLPTSV